jgi:hypothetical protein
LLGVDLVPEEVVCEIVIAGEVSTATASSNRITFRFAGIVVTPVSEDETAH